MGRSRIAWAGSAFAPWALALGLVLSITAEAGQDPLQDASVYVRDGEGEAQNPQRAAIAAASPWPDLQAVDADGWPLPIVQARLTTGAANDLAGAPDEIDPNPALKSGKIAFPQIDRAMKGDPFILLRPGFDARRRRAGAREAQIDDSWPNPVQGPWEADFGLDSGTSPTGAQTADQIASSGSLTFDDGATPALSLEFALNSSSPTPNDGVLLASVQPTAPVAPQTTLALQSESGQRPNYATLVDPKDAARQMRCLAEAIYFESRGEPENGQAAVAQVVLNRVRSGIYPASVCGVVYQDRNRPFACQFSFACEGKSLRIEEPGPWAVATRIAQEVVSGVNYNPKVGEAVNYHANYVSPFWIGYLRKVDHIGNHIFYAMREGVNWAPGALNGNGDRPLAAK
jgi:spore germination cell wall hydrolase CwlJ-like protein